VLDPRTKALLLAGGIVGGVTGARALGDAGQNRVKQVHLNNSRRNDMSTPMYDPTVVKRAYDEFFQMKLASNDRDGGIFSTLSGAASKTVGEGASTPAPSRARPGPGWIWAGGHTAAATGRACAWAPQVAARAHNEAAIVKRHVIQRAPHCRSRQAWKRLALHIAWGSCCSAQQSAPPTCDGMSPGPVLHCAFFKCVFGLPSFFKVTPSNDCTHQRCRAGRPHRRSGTSRCRGASGRRRAGPPAA